MADKVKVIGTDGTQILQKDAGSGRVVDGSELVDSSGNELGVTVNPLAIQGVSGGTPIPTSAPVPGSANVLDGFQSFAATTAATTLITVPASRTWIGEIGCSVSCQEAAAGTVAAQARAVFSVAGAGAVPSGNVAAWEAKAGANSATGTVGDDAANKGRQRLVVIAPAGNSVTVQVTTTQAGTASTVDAWAIGELQ